MPRRAEPEEDYTTVEIPTNGGMHSGGDAAKIPSGFFRKIRNMLREAGVWEKRPQFTYDILSGIRGLAVWHDMATGKRRLYAIEDTGSGAGLALGNAYVKNSSGETWSTRIDAASQATTGIGGYVNYRGRLVYIKLSATFAPQGLRYFNGTTDDQIKMDGADSLTVQPACIAMFKERMFLGGVNFFIQNLLFDSPTNYMYDAANWTAVNVTRATLTSSGTTYRVTPTNTTTASLTAPVDIEVFGNSPGYAGAGTAIWRADLRNTSPTYRVPLTMELKHTYAWAAATGFAVGDTVVPTTVNGFRYRQTVNGTSGGVEPVWPTTVGTTVADNGMLWICDGSDVAGSTEFYLPPLSEISTFITNVCKASIPNGTYAILRATLKFGNTSEATYTLTSIDFGFVDSLTDGDPRKDNHGHQITRGTYPLPFCNVNTGSDSNVAVKDQLFWTPVGQPEVIEASASFKMTEVPGDITAIVSVAGKLVVFKRDATWVFAAVEDANLVVLPEGEAHVGFGCLHGKAVDVFRDVAYFVGDDEVYRWSPGMNAPEALCGDGMRDEIMNKASATWVESQTAPANVPLLKVDQRRRLVYVYTQKGKLYVFHLDEEVWSVLEAGGDTSVSPTGKQIAAMEYNPNTGNMYFAFTEAPAGTAGLARLDESQSPAKDSYSTSGTSDVHAEMWPKPFELTGPRHELLLDNVKVYHKATASQTGQTTTAYVSRDHGVTFPKSNQVTLAPVSTGGYRPMRISLFQSWGSLLLRILHSGNGGATSFNVSRMEADMQVLSGEYTKDRATPGSATL